MERYRPDKAIQQISVMVTIYGLMGENRSADRVYQSTKSGRLFKGIL